MATVELILTIFEDGADDPRTAYLTSSLVKQLRQLELDYLHPLEPGSSPAGAKGDPFTVGALVVGLGTAALPVLLDFLRTWVGDRRKLVVEAPNGAKIEFYPNKRLTTDEIIEFMQKLNQV